MQFPTLCLMSMFIMFGCSAYGEDVIEKRDQVVARSGNLESLLIAKLFSAMESDIKELKEQQSKYDEENSKLREEIMEQQTQHEAEKSKLREETMEIMEKQIKMEEENIKLREEIMEQQTIQEKQISELELKVGFEEKPKTIYAQVQLLGDHKMSQRQRVKFTGTIANIGEAYKTTQGYFVAPYDGTYLFTVTICMTETNWLVFRIVQENSILSEGLSGDARYYACASATAATYMRSGSKVWVEIDLGSGRMISSKYGISSFTGVLINNFKKP